MPTPRRTEAAQASVAQANHRRVLGPWQLIALGVGTSLGAGIFAITGIAAGQNGGAAVSICFLIAAIACSFVGMAYAELSSMFPNASGSAYAYASEGIGEGFAWAIGWCLLAAYMLALSMVASSWAGYLASFLQEWGIILDPRFLAPTGTLVHLPGGVTASAFFNLPAVLAICGMAALQLGGVQESTRLNAFMVALKVGVIITFILACVPKINLANYHPYLPANTGQFGHFGWSGVLRGAALVFCAYPGFDIVASAARETRNPQRNLPIGLLGTLAICACIYIVFSGVLVGTVNYRALAHDPSPVATAMNAVGIPWLAELVKLGILIGFFAVLYGVLFGQSRSLLNMAEDGLIPPIFKRVTPHTKAPWGALVGLAGLSSLLGACLTLDALGNIISMGFLLTFIMVCASVIVLRYRRPQAERPFRIPGGNWLIPCLGILSCAGVLMGMDSATWARMAIWGVVGVVIYFCYGKRHSHQVREAAARKALAAERV